MENKNNSLPVDHPTGNEAQSTVSLTELIKIEGLVQSIIDAYSVVMLDEHLKQEELLSFLENTEAFLANKLQSVPILQNAIALKTLFERVGVLKTVLVDGNTPAITIKNLGKYIAISNGFACIESIHILENTIVDSGSSLIIINEPIELVKE
jgi:hypothetical protein